MHGFLFCSDHPDCTLLPQAQHIAAACAEHPLDLAMIAFQQFLGHIGLNGSCKAAALHPPGTAALQDSLAQRQRHGEPLMPHIRAAIDVLT